jgi:subtilisin family serine protease
LTNSFAILCSHGTAVSGIIAGLKGNNICTVGVAYDASIVGKIPINNVVKAFFI